MLRVIIVPVDGSGFGEQAIPMARWLAARDRADLELVHVYEAIPPWRTRGAHPLDPGLDHELQKDRQSYLDGLAEILRRQGSTRASATVLTGESVGGRLADYIGERRVDLVVMSTHGRSGFSQIWYGSVAADVVRRSPAPVLLIKPEASPEPSREPESLSQVLIPLDLSTPAREVIDHALTVAGDRAITVTLFHVVTPILFYAPTPAIGVPLPDEAQEQAAAEEYLAQVAEPLRARGVRVETSVIRGRHPAAAILETAVTTRANLIAMTTHGLTGFTRLMVGSVADKVIRAAPVPVLVHRPTAAADQTETASLTEHGVARRR